MKEETHEALTALAEELPQSFRGDCATVSGRNETRPPAFHALLLFRPEMRTSRRLGVVFCMAYVIWFMEVAGSMSTDGNGERPL